MGRIDRDALRAHLLAMDEAATVLRSKIGWSAEDLRGDPTKLWVVAHGLQLATQNALGVAAHIGGALLPGRTADDYRDALLTLGELGVVDRDFAERIAPMAGLRNIIVHGYLRLQAERLLDTLQHLDDFRMFATAIDAFLAANPGL